MAEETVNEVIKEGVGKVRARKRAKKERISPVEREIRLLVETGKVSFGTRQAVKAVLLGEVKGVIYARNLPKEVKTDVIHYAQSSGIEAIEFSGTSMELGKLCGRPHPVGVLAIYEEGEGSLERLKKLV